MQKKEKVLVCFAGFLLGMNHRSITTNPKQSMLQCNGTIPVHLLVQPNISGYAISWEDFACSVLGLSGSAVSLLSEA
jgi:hypothetical protein